MANLTIPHHFLDIVSIEDEYFKESWKYFVRILSCQAAYSGFIPTNLHIHKKIPGNKGNHGDDDRCNLGCML